MKKPLFFAPSFSHYPNTQQLSVPAVGKKERNMVSPMVGAKEAHNGFKKPGKWMLLASSNPTTTFLVTNKTF